MYSYTLGKYKYKDTVELGNGIVGTFVEERNELSCSFTVRVNDKHLTVCNYDKARGTKNIVTVDSLKYSVEGENVIRGYGNTVITYNIIPVTQTATSSLESYPECNDDI